MCMRCRSAHSAVQIKGNEKKEEDEMENICIYIYIYI